MANLYNIEPLSYQPSTNMDWFTQAVFGGRLIETGKITPFIGIKESTLLNLIGLEGNILQPDGRDCAWTPEQILKLSEKELKIKTYKINLEQCINDLERKRTGWMLKPGAKNTELPDKLEEATMFILSTELSKEIEAKIFNGNSSTNPKDFDGAVKVLTDSQDAAKVVGVALSIENILTEIQKCVLAWKKDAMTKALENSTACLYLSKTVELYVKMALGDSSNNNSKTNTIVVNQGWTIENGTVRYLDIELVPVLGLDDSTMILADIENLILGTDLLSDTEEIRLGQFPAPHDNKIFIDGRLRLGFVIPFEDEVVFYSPNNTAPQGLKATRAVTQANSTNTGEAKVYEKTATQVIALIKEAKTIEAVQSLIEGDDRKTVKDEANKRIAEIQANSTNTGGE